MIANSTKSSFKILVDADSCPVKETISKLALEFAVTVVFIASIAHKTENLYSNVEYIWVDSMPQEVDMAIVNKLSPGDLIVTGDYGLASLVLAKQGRAISPRGYIYLQENIEKLLAKRHMDAKIRRSGGRTKGPKALSDKDKKRFESSLRDILTALKAK